MAHSSGQARGLARRWVPALGCGVVLLAAALVVAAQDAGTNTPDRPAVALNLAPPEYPRHLVRKGVDGKVVLVVTIDTQGMASDVLVETSSGSEHLDAAAVQAAHAWGFIPAMRAGRPVASRMRVPLNFVDPKPGPATQESTVLAPYSPPSALETPGPQYPKAAAWQGVDGTVVLIVSINTEGTVSELEIETSSGNATLDAAALWAARSWRFNPAIRGGEAMPAQVRVPVAFEIPPQYALDRVTRRTRDGYFQQRREGAMPEPAADSEGRFPGFVEDRYPIGVESVAEGERMLERYAFREADAVAGEVQEYTLRDEEGMSVWNVVALDGGPRAMVRRRLVGNGTKSWYASSVLCEGEAARCADLRAFLKASVPAQDPTPALPELPPLQER